MVNHPHRSQQPKPATEHTPTPWTIGMSVSGRLEIHGVSGPIASWPDKCATDKANAAFIVRAVNAHEALVAALARAVNALEATQRAPDTAERAKAALRLAREEG